MLRDLSFRLRALVRRQAVESELDDELSFHFEQQAEKLVQSGVPVPEARRRAHLLFGGSEAIKEECREARGIHFLETLARNVRYAFRALRMAPIFTATAMLNLALGIGGTTAIFNLIHVVMLRSLPVSNPDSLYRVGDGDICCAMWSPQGRWGMFSFSLYERLKTETPAFEELAAFQGSNGNMSVRRAKQSESNLLRSEYVTGNYFSTFGVGAFGGRVFNQDDDKPDAQPVAVLSYQSWQSKYGSDAGREADNGIFACSRRRYVLAVSQFHFNARNIAETGVRANF